ncbi:MAG: peptidyl-prolyl cis-trans isomerase [Hyphomicrobiales bacterium]|nr:peptidyl-prolyl cis-trans isomerase [Hyphomicrobiales bacterium]
MNAAKEPLFHFLLAGATLFGAYHWLNRTPERPDTSTPQQVHVRAGDVQWMVENWTRQWRRPPTPEELRGLVVNYVNEQLLAREARALRLDDNDVIVRRWLAQKLTFLIEGTLRHSEPSEEELQQFYQERVDRFRADPRISFKHIYFSQQRRADAQTDAALTLAALVKNGSIPADDLGDPTLIETEFDNETEQSISIRFGADFAQAVFALEPETWGGPIPSGYGLHLVRVSAVTPAQPRPLSEVRARVVEAWMREREKTAKERYLADLRKKYAVMADETTMSVLKNAALDGAQAND